MDRVCYLRSAKVNGGWWFTIEGLNHGMKGFQRNSAVPFGQNIDPQSKQHAGPFWAQRVSHTYNTIGITLMMLILKSRSSERALQRVLLPAECDRTKFSCSSLWNKKCVVISQHIKTAHSQTEDRTLTADIKYCLYLSLLTGMTVRANLPKPVVIP